jgi:hypothetical protein
MHILELLIELLLGESTFLQELRDMRQVNKGFSFQIRVYRFAFLTRV